MVTPTYNIGTNTISWNYDESLNWVDIYKFNTQNTTITHSSTELVPNFQSPNTYSLQISSLQLMGEQGITNANPYLLNTDPGYYQLGLSGSSGPFVITDKFAITDNDTPIPDINGIPTYNSSTDVVNFSYSGNVDYVELYKVGYPANNRRFIDASAHIVDIVGSSPNYSVDLTNVTLFDKQGGTSLGPIVDNGGTYYMGLKPSANPFTISGFFDIMPNTFKWVNTFPVGGVAVTGGEAQSNSTFNLNANYNAFKSTTWDTTSNLVRIPILWAYKSKENNDDLLFTNRNQDLNNISGQWAYDTTYATEIKNIVADCISKNKVVMIDYHTYTTWNTVNKGPTIIANIWIQTLKVFNILDSNLFKNPLVWFEIVNEPYAINNLSDYQPVINAIRAEGYMNKIILGIDAYNDAGHVVVNVPGNIFNNGFNAYSGGFPTDSANNLCVTLHQYFNQNGSGSGYSSGGDNDMCSPSWLVGGNTLTNGTSLYNVLVAISNKCGSHCDIMVGEFGYDQSYSPTVGKTAVQKMLDTMEQANNINTNANINSTTILTKTQGGVWLGFAAWVFASSGYTIDNRVNDAVFNDVYLKYF